MTALLLDTTFLIDAERDAAALEGSIADDDDVAVAAITVAELQVGVELAEEPRRSERAAFLAEIIDTVPVLSYGSDVAFVHGALLAATRRAGRPRGAHDLIIAATARATGRTVVTADPTGFEDLPGVLLQRHR